MKIKMWSGTKESFSIKVLLLWEFQNGISEWRVYRCVPVRYDSYDRYHRLGRFHPEKCILEAGV